MQFCQNCGAETFNRKSCWKCGYKISSSFIGPVSDSKIEYFSDFIERAPYITALLMFLVTDIILITSLHVIYNLFIVSIWNSGRLSSVDAKVIKQALIDLQLYHGSIYFLATFIAVIQMTLFLLIINFDKKIESFSKSIWKRILYLLAPSFHALLFIVIIFSLQLNYEFNYLLTRIILSGIAIGFVFHVPYRLIKVIWLSSDKESDKFNPDNMGAL